MVPLAAVALMAITAQPHQDHRARPPAAVRQPAGPQGGAGALIEAITNRIWLLGDQYWHAGRHEDLIAVDYLVVELDPQFVDAYSGAAFLLDSDGRPQEAEALLKLATKRIPDQWEAWSELGDFMERQNRHAEAAAAYERAAGLPGCFVKVYRSLGHAYRLAGDLKRSLAAWERARAREPGDPVVENNLRRVRALLEAEQKKK